MTTKEGEPVLSANLTKTRHFFSASREIRWLNELGRQGFRLWAVKDGKYSFTVESGRTFRYSMEWQDCALDSLPARERILEKANLGEPVCAQRSLWLYFVSEHQSSLSKPALKKNRAHYRNPFLFFLILTLICAALIVYHVKSVPFLESQGLTITVPTFKGNENPILDLLLRLVYGLWLVVYNYFLLFGHFLGNTLATAVVSVLVPLALTFLIVAVVWGIEWIRWLRVKPSGPAEPEKEDGEDPSAPESEGSVSKGAGSPEERRESRENRESGVLEGKDEEEVFFRAYGKPEDVPPEESGEDELILDEDGEETGAEPDPGNEETPAENDSEERPDGHE